MDGGKYSTLLEVLKDIADPRKARGKRYEWWLILAVVASALASGQQNGRAIAQWVREHAQELVERLQPKRQQVPSEATIRRALQVIDVATLEARLGALALACDKAGAASSEAQPGKRPQVVGHAIDGKAVRGASQRGQKLHLVSLVRHGDGLILAQEAVAEKSNEITAVPRLLDGRDLEGMVLTMDALLTQRAIAEQILAQGGHYLMIVKENQPSLYQAIELLFDQPPWRGPEYAHEVQRVQTITKGHGRLDQRFLECDTALADYLDWPGVQQVMRRTCRRTILKSGQVQEEITFGMTSLPRLVASAPHLEHFWRGHWTIENRVHYVRDVSFAEDRSQIHTANAPHSLAALRNAIINLCRANGWRLIPDALRHYGASVDRALRLIGVHGL